MPETSSRRRLVNAIAVALILGGIAPGVWRSYGSAGRVRRACEAIVPGWTLVELRAHADDRGLKLSYGGQSPGAAYLFDWLTRDDFLCDIALSAGQVVTARYIAPNDN